MEFILHNHTLEILIYILSFVNLIYISIKDMKDSSLKTLKNMVTRTKIERFSIIYIACCLLIGIILILKNKTTFSLFLLLIIICCFIGTIRHITLNKSELKQDDKSMYVISTIFFSLFFSAYATSIYLEMFEACLHVTKEVLVLIFINAKIILFVFSLLINLIILIENFIGTFQKKGIKIEEDYKKIRESQIEPIIYDFNLYAKYLKRRFLILDVILFMITTPIGLILTIIQLILVKSVVFLYTLLVKIIRIINKFYQNRNDFLITIIKITMIISLTLTNIIIIWEMDIFSEQLIDIFNFISSVILIPLIYDQIKSN